MRLVAEAVVPAGCERVETLKSGAVGAHAEDRAAVRVAAQGGAAVEKTLRRRSATRAAMRHRPR